MLATLLMVLCSLLWMKLCAVILFRVSCSVVILWVRHLVLVMTCLARVWLLRHRMWLWLDRWPRVNRTNGVVHEVRNDSSRAKKTNGHGLGPRPLGVRTPYSS